MATAEWQRKSHDICILLQQSDRVTNARTILAYTSFRQEPDLMPFITHMARDRHFALPRCQGKTIIWHYWHPHQSAPLVTGAYGILEPDPSWPIFTPDPLVEDAILLVPAVGCDRQGYRIGYGSGFYDRMLSNPDWDAITTIGIVFDFACLDSLPMDSWDQPLSGVCTENELMWVRR